MVCRRFAFENTIFNRRHNGRRKNCGLLRIEKTAGQFVKGIRSLFSTYRVCFAILGIPAVITIALVAFSKIKYPDPEMFEKQQEEAQEFRFQKSFIFYMMAICLFAFGFADFTLITLHAAKVQAFPDSTLSPLYAVAMAVDAFAALFFGPLFDKIGLKALMLSTALSTSFSCFIFLTGNPSIIGIGIILWGIGMGAQESIMKAAVSSIIPRSMRSAGFTTPCDWEGNEPGYTYVVTVEVAADGTIVSATGE